MPPAKRDASKSPSSKGARKRSTSRARSKSPGRRGRVSKADKSVTESPPIVTKSESKSESETGSRGRGRSKSPGRKGKSEPVKEAVAVVSPSPPRRQQKKATEAVSRKKASLSPPAKKASSPPRKKRASTPPRKKRSPSPPVEKKQLRARKSTTPAVAELTADISSAIAKKMNDIRETIRAKESKESKESKETKETKEKVVTVTTTSETIVTKKEKKVEKKGSNSYEFGGPFGAFVLTLLLPTVIVAVNLACTKESCVLTKLPNIPKTLSSYYDANAVLLFVGWFAFQAILTLLPVGRIKEGLPLASGKRLKYRCNGFLNLLISLAVFGVLVYQKYPVTIVIDLFQPLTVTAIVFALVISELLYLKSRYSSADSLSAGGNTGNIIYDHFVGRELNPRIGNFDIKMFFESRFGLIAWVLLNATFLLKAYQSNNGSIPSALILVSAFQFLYVADGLWYEENMLSMLDIASDGLGFMMTLGNIAWLPFLYTLQGRYLLDHPQPWSYLALIFFALLNMIGYFIFRGSNWQKHVFLTNQQHPSVAALEVIPATSGQRLLVGGWWGLCRHPNYLGDLIMAVAWSLPCGFASPLPYFYPFNLLLLLIHRASRDNRKCQQKFGAAWERYCHRVKYVIIPYVY